MTFLKGGWCPDLPARKKVKPRKTTAKFGDGYEQNVLDGINNINTEWDLTYKMRTRAVILAMESFLRTNAGGTIKFYDYDDDQVYDVYYDEWNIEWNYNESRKNVGSLSIKFRRAFGAYLP